MKLAVRKKFQVPGLGAYNFRVYEADAVRWRELAERALREEDEEKFLTIIQELNEILERRRQRLKEQNQPFRRPPVP